MSLGLGPIPSQKYMTPEQEQAFTNGLNRGRKIERQYIIKLLDGLACDNPFCRKFGLMRSHSGCQAVRYHIGVLTGKIK